MSRSAPISPGCCIRMNCASSRPAIPGKNRLCTLPRPTAWKCCAWPSKGSRCQSSSTSTKSCAIARATPSIACARSGPRPGRRQSIVFLMGADQLQQLDTWKEWRPALRSTPISAPHRGRGFAIDAHGLPPRWRANSAAAMRTPEQIRNTPHGLTCLALQPGDGCVGYRNPFAAGARRTPAIADSRPRC